MSDLAPSNYVYSVLRLLLMLSLSYLNTDSLKTAEISDFSDDESLFLALDSVSCQRTENWILNNATRLRWTEVYIVFHYTDSGEYVVYNSQPNNEHFPPNLRELVSLAIHLLLR